MEPELLPQEAETGYISANPGRENESGEKAPESKTEAIKSTANGSPKETRPTSPVTAQDTPEVSTGRPPKEDHTPQ